jgi:hypothetical protein
MQKVQFSNQPSLTLMKVGELVDSIENNIPAKNFTTLCPAVFVVQGCKNHKKISFFGMPPPLKIIITFVPYKLQSLYQACLKANEMLFSEISNSH